MFLLPKQSHCSWSQCCISILFVCLFLGTKLLYKNEMEGRLYAQKGIKARRRGSVIPPCTISFLFLCPPLQETETLPLNCLLSRNRTLAKTSWPGSSTQTHRFCSSLTVIGRGRYSDGRFTHTPAWICALINCCWLWIGGVDDADKICRWGFSCVRW